VIRTDAINQQILSLLARVHESHVLHTWESDEHWQAVCGGCLHMLSYGLSVAKKFEELDLPCSIKYPKAFTTFPVEAKSVVSWQGEYASPYLHSPSSSLLYVTKLKPSAWKDSDETLTDDHINEAHSGTMDAPLVNFGKKAKELRYVAHQNRKKLVEAVTELTAGLMGEDGENSNG
jgi:hypothetical protein